MSLTRREWAEHVDSWRSSGKVARDYCASRGLKLSALRYWASRLRREAGDALKETMEVTPRFAKVKLRSPSPVGSGSPSRASDLRLVLGDLEVAVPVGFDAETLERLLGVVRSKSGDAR